MQEALDFSGERSLERETALSLALERVRASARVRRLCREVFAGTHQGAEGEWWPISVEQLTRQDMLDCHVKTARRTVATAIRLGLVRSQTDSQGTSYQIAAMDRLSIAGPTCPRQGQLVPGRANLSQAGPTCPSAPNAGGETPRAHARARSSSSSLQEFNDDDGNDARRIIERIVADLWPAAGRLPLDGRELPSLAKIAQAVAQGALSTEDLATAIAAGRKVAPGRRLAVVKGTLRNRLDPGGAWCMYDRRVNGLAVDRAVLEAARKAFGSETGTAIAPQSVAEEPAYKPEDRLADVLALFGPAAVARIERARERRQS